MSRAPSIVPVIVLVLGTVPLPPPAAARKQPRCPDGSYVVIGKRLVTGDPAGAPADMVTITGRKVGIRSGCPDARARVKGTKKGTKVNAKWRRCGELRKVRLRALIDQACATMTGIIKWKGSGGPQAFDGIETSQTTTTTVAAPTTTSTSTTTTTTSPGGTTTTLAFRNCDASDMQQVLQVMENGGRIELDCFNLTITLDDTLVVDGVAAEVLGPPLANGNRGTINVVRDLGNAAQFRLIHVKGGATLTMDGVFLQGGRDFGANGGNGDFGEDGNGGALGDPDNQPGAAGGNGGPGELGAEAGAGGTGGLGRGAAVLVEAGSSATFRHCSVRLSGAVGGRGGDAGDFRRVGNGGPGGRGGSGEGTDAPDGGDGGIGAEARDGKDGGDGGPAQGGAFWNGGTLVVEQCSFESNFTQGGFAGDAGFGESGAHGGSGGAAGHSTNTNPSGQPSNMGMGGDGGDGGFGRSGKDGGNGGNGGTALGGAIYNEGTLVVSDTSFRNNFAVGTDAGYGASGGAGGWGGNGGIGGIGMGCGMGGNGADAAGGGDGGHNGDGGSGIGGAIYSTNQPTLTNITYGPSPNTVAGGSGGVNNCTPGGTGCFGAAGPGGIGGLKGIGGQTCFPVAANPPTPPGPDGTAGVDGADGVDGQEGAPGAGVDPNCHAGGLSCG